MTPPHITLMWPKITKTNKKAYSKEKNSVFTQHLDIPDNYIP